MRAAVLALALLVAFAGIVAIAPTATAGPPDLGSGCGYFHWHNGDVKNGILPGYHLHPCYD